MESKNAEKNALLEKIKLSNKKVMDLESALEDSEMKVK